MGEDPEAQLVHEALAEATGEPDAGRAGQDADEDGDQVEPGDGDQHARVLLGDALVDADLGQQGTGLQGDGLEHHQAEGPEQPESVGGEEVAQREGRLARLALDEVDLGLGVFGLGVEDGLDPVGELRRDAGERQAGGRALTHGAAAPHAPGGPTPRHQPTSPSAADSSSSGSSRWDTMST